MLSPDGRKNYAWLSASVKCLVKTRNATGFKFGMTLTVKISLIKKLKVYGICGMCGTVEFLFFFFSSAKFKIV